MNYIIGFSSHGPTAIMLSVVFGCLVLITVGIFSLSIEKVRQKRKYWLRYLETVSDNRSHIFQCARGEFCIHRQLGENSTSVLAKAVSHLALLLKLEKGVLVYVIHIKHGGWKTRSYISVTEVAKSLQEDQ